jgi:hypothetical protein
LKFLMVSWTRPGLLPSVDEECVAIAALTNTRTHMVVRSKQAWCWLVNRANW